MAPAAPASDRSKPISPDPTSGSRRPLLPSYSPSNKGDQESQHVNKRVRPMESLPTSTGPNDIEIEDVTQEEADGQRNQWDSDMQENPDVWNQRKNFLFEERNTIDDWYVADSDSEDVAEAMREEDDVVDDEEEDPLCPSILSLQQRRQVLDVHGDQLWWLGV
ncbi:hypothetical protein LINGRAHAP2_LOCUS23458 [Linum grandiflorum]